MCKTTKGTQAAANGSVIGIQPNTASGGGVVTPPAPVVIRREHVPEIVFIAEASDHDNGFISSANTFHNFFGFRGTKRRTFTSIQHLAQLLAGAATPLSRIRIVAHADNTGIFSPMVAGDERVNIEKTEMRNFIAGDGVWLFSKIHIFHFLGSGSAARDVTEAILSHILQDTTHAAVLTPFGYTDTSHPGAELINFVLCAATPLVVNGNFLKKGTTTLTNLTAAQKAAFITAFDKILVLAGSNLMGSGSFAGVTTTHLNNLKTAIRSFTLADYNFTPGTTPLTDDFIKAVVINVSALNNHFRENLEAAQQRFSTASWIDIRGCRAGTDRDYLTAVSEFFGRSGNRPHVSGPTWYQMFPGIGYVDSPDAVSIDDALNNGVDGVTASTFKTNLDNWFSAIGYTDQYFNVWRTALTSKAAAFCLLTWRSNIPSGFLIREGKQNGIAALNFVDTIKRIKSIFGIANTAQPTQASLNSIKDFVADDLPGYMTQLTQAVPSSGSLDTIFNSLKTISTTLSASIVPATAPPGLTPEQVRQYQTDLIDFISTNQLQRIHTLLQTAQTNITGPNGKYHLYLRFGLSGVIFISNDFIKSRLFVLRSEKNNALRIFLKEMWEEPLPTPNNISSAVLDEDHPAHRAISALTSDHSDTSVTLAPMPDYFTHIETI